MLSTKFSSLRTALTLTCLGLVVCSCPAVVVTEPSPSQFTSVTSSERFLFWEKCEDQWNKEKKVTERCCKGNYKCSSDICKDNRLCSSGFFGGLLWCNANSCKPKNSNGNNDQDKDKDKEDKDRDSEEDDEPMPSGEEEWTPDSDEKSEMEEEDKSPSPSAKASPTATSSPTPSPKSSPPPKASPSPVTTNSPPPQQDNDPLHCNGRRNRREIRDMSAEQRREWQQAIIELRADRDGNGDSEWDRLVRTHMDFNDEAHGGAYFLPWHRIFLLRLENALRRKRPNLALPYWDWARDADDAALSRVWDADFAGGARRVNMPIQSGPFQNIESRYPFRQMVRRDFTSGQSGQMQPLWRMGSLNQLIEVESFGDFSDGVEAAHALPHIYIGGGMADVHQAPNDPIFYLHHAFIDYLYSLRQQRHGAYQFGGSHDFRDGTVPARAGRVMQAFGVPASRAFDLSCVHYVQPNTQGRNIAGRGGRGRGSDVCANDMFTTGESLTVDRCRHGEEVLESTQ